MTPTLRAFRAEDLLAIVNRDGEQVPHEIIQRQAVAGTSFTACIDDRPIGCAGLVVVWPGVAITWMVLSEEACRYGIWLTRTVRTFLRTMQRVHDLHRIEALALQNSNCNQRWLELLGFSREENGLARALLQDRRNLIRYELVKGG